MSVRDATWPPDVLRNLAIYMLASKGAGKSRLIGRLICRNDLWQGIPQVVIDGVGGTIDNILDCIIRLAPRQRRDVLSRILYFDMSGQSGYVCPLPLYYCLGRETWNDMASRYLQTILMLDPNLTSASIQGANAMFRVGIPTGMVLAASGWQLSEAGLLLDRPALFKQHLKKMRAETDDRGLQGACDFFIAEYLGWESKKRVQEAGSFRGKVNLLVRDNPTLAAFSASKPGFDLQQVIDAGQTVLLDFRGDQQNLELLKFKMMWSLDYFLNFIKNRGAGLNHKPIGLVIDEISMLQSFDAATSNGNDLFAALIDALLNIWSRQGMVNVTIANQEMFQISPRLFKTLMSCGTVICGLTSDWDAAVYLAREFMPAQPHRVKRYDPIYRSDDTVRDYRQVDMSLEEQTQQNAAMFKNLEKFHFLVKEVGNPRMWLLDISDLDPGLYPDVERIAELRAMLSARRGVPIRQVLAEIEQRQAAIQNGQTLSGESQPIQKQMKPTRRSAKLASNDQWSEPDYLPAASEDYAGLEDLRN